MRGGGARFFLGGLNYALRSVLNLYVGGVEGRLRDVRFKAHNDWGGGVFFNIGFCINARDTFVLFVAVKARVLVKV